MSDINGTTLLVIDRNELERLFKKATKNHEYLVKPETAKAMFDISKDSLHRLAVEGFIKRYETERISGVRYDPEEIRNLFKAI